MSPSWNSNVLKGSAVDLVWKQTDKTGEHWMWTGAVNAKGYGTMSYGGVVLGAHVIVYIYHYGEIPDGFVVMHTCDIPGCLRPEHLRLGTYTDNLKDAIDKGRHSNPIMHGAVNPAARLTEDAVREIRYLSANGISNPELARQYGVDRSIIWKIVTRRSWVKSA